MPRFNKHLIASRGFKFLNALQKKRDKTHLAFKKFNKVLNFGKTSFCLKQINKLF